MLIHQKQWQARCGGEANTGRFQVEANLGDRVILPPLSKLLLLFNSDNRKNI